MIEAVHRITRGSHNSEPQKRKRTSKDNGFSEVLKQKAKEMICVVLIGTIQRQVIYLLK